MDQLRALVLASLSAPAPFDAFQDLLDHACDTLSADGTAHSISDLRLLTTKHKGDLWELFCRQYLLHVHGCSEAWLLRDVPADVLTRLSMRRADLGIDLVAVKGKETLAVQCKWRQPQRFKVVPGTRIRTNVVPWKDLSTFLALTDRLGCFQKKIVMTNAVGVRRVAGRKPGDVSLCIGTFQALTGAEYLDMMECKGNRLDDPTPATPPLDLCKPKTLEGLRAARLKALGAS